MISGFPGRLPSGVHLYRLACIFNTLLIDFLPPQVVLTLILS